MIIRLSDTEHINAWKIDNRIPPNQNSRKKKKMKAVLRALRYHSAYQHSIMGVPEREEREEGIGKGFEEAMIENLGKEKDICRYRKHIGSQTR